MTIRVERFAQRRHWVALFGLGGAMTGFDARPVAAQHHASAVTIGVGAGALGVSRDGLVRQVSAGYDRSVNRWSRWWVSLQGMHDGNPGVSSPGLKQSVKEIVVATGPSAELPLGARAAVTAGFGVYGVARRYGVGRRADGGPALTDASWGGGDWGTVGRAGLRVGSARGYALVLDGQLRLAREGSVRSVQPMFGVGVRRGL